ncbi:MAG: efflux RND transporter periplasmic adaptor subunit [Armatimonadetes bacterium]|nr:efflux RND transporter periplasmic adaptor subunit [Armatimonadota bacterium]
MAGRPALIAAIVVLLGAGAAGLHLAGAGSQARAADPQPQQPPPVPVTTAAAKTEDVPVYLRGIGTVQAFYAVAVKAQVSGVLIDVPVREGQEVKKGAVLAVIDPRPYKAALDRATATRQQDQAQLENAQLDLKRYSNLARSDFASRQQVDTQQANVDKLQAAVAGDTAAIETASLNLSFCYIVSPIDGRVSLRQVDPGNLVEAASQATGIVSVTQDHPISVVFTLPEQELPQVQEAMTRGPLTVLADTSDGQTQLAKGTLLTPNNAVDINTGTIQLKANFANEDNKLWPGEFVNARLLVNTIRGVVTVPHIAIQHGQDGLFVFVVKPDNTVEQQAVTVSYDDGTRAVVGKGVSSGAKIVTSGQSRLGQGTRVTAAPPDQEG